MNLYTILGWIATVAVPISPVFFFGWEVYKQVLTRSSSWLLAGGVGLVSAIGLEIVGILAGHLAMEFWRSGRMNRAYLAAGIMAIYVLIGIVELWGTIGVVMFLIAPLVYVLVALNQVAEYEQREGEKDKKRSQVIDYRQHEAEAQRKHDLELERLRLANEVKLAKVNAATIAQPVTVAAVAPPVAELTETQQRILDAFRAQPDATITAIAEQLGVSRQAVSKQAKKMNGVLHEVRL